MLEIISARAHNGRSEHIIKADGACGKGAGDTFFRWLHIV